MYIFCDYKNFIITKNVHFLRMGHRNVVHKKFFRSLEDIISLPLAIDPPFSSVFWGFEGGGAVENQDPSGACGGLFCLIFSICISFLDQYYRFIMAIFKKYIVLFDEIQKEKKKITCFCKLTWNQSTSFIFSLMSGSVLHWIIWFSSIFKSVIPY